MHTYTHNAHSHIHTERSPLRVRFDAQDGGASLSVVVKVANQLKPTFIQASAPL